ncbi:MAG: hypothetical protein ACTSQ9_01345, partial [Candidatus Hodarchaeales archaeon]
LKAYNKFTKLNWLVGKKVVSLTAGIITIGSIMGLGANILVDTLARLQLIIDLVLFCVVNVSLIVILIAIFYNIFFQGTFYKRITESIDVGFGVTSVTLVDEHGDEIITEETDEVPSLIENDEESQILSVETKEEDEIASTDTSIDAHTPSEQEE